MYYLLLYDLVDQFAERRPPYRDAHLKLARAAADNGELLLVLQGYFAACRPRAGKPCDIIGM